MLKRLTIQNYALIDQIDMRFDSGLHILTGETGAGKSIILGALGLVMGKRADLKALYDPAKNCLVEASLDIKANDLETLLVKHDLDIADELVIRRVISKNGKSRAFINDLPVSLKSLQEISIRLIQIHNQFDNLDLSQPAYQLKMLDALGRNQEVLERYHSSYTQWQSAKKNLKALQLKVQEFEKEKDFFQFQYDELSPIDLEQYRDDKVEENLEILSNAESIQQVLKMAFYKISEDDNSLVYSLNRIIKEMQQAGGGTELIEILSNSLESIADDLSQIGDDIYKKAEKVEYDPIRISELQVQLDQINKLLHKHKFTDIESLIGFKKEIEGKLSLELELSDAILEQEKEIQSIERKMDDLAKTLNKRRSLISKDLEKQVAQQLKQLGMPYARLAGRFIKTEDFGPTGTDEYELLFSANKGSDPESIQQVASGGELSRLSLSIKSILAGHMALPTLIFDEIEAGISGEIALKMGKILKDLSKDHQVINITHSAQIASRGDKHFFVYKSHTKDKTITRIKELNAEQRISEIAKMLSGDPPSPTAIKNATELIHLN